MKITFWGVGGDPAVPGNRLVVNMVECGGAVYFVDGGSNLAEALLKTDRDPGAVRAVFITHYHGDHTAGVFPLVDLVQWAYRSTNLTVLYPTEELRDATCKMLVADLSAYDGVSDRLDLKVAAAGRAYEDELITVDYIPNRHFADGVTPSYCILLTEKQSGRSVLFSGDMSYGLKGRDFPSEALSLQPQLLVSELYHFDLKDILPYLSDYRGRVAFVHLFEKENKREALLALNGKHSFSVTVPTDGDEEEI